MMNTARNLMLTTLTLDALLEAQAEAARRNIIIADAAPGDANVVVISAARIEIVDRFVSSIMAELMAEEAGVAECSMRFDGIELGVLGWSYSSRWVKPSNCKECKGTRKVERDQFRGDWSIATVTVDCPACTN
jgi:hypothetical protein